MSNVFQVDATLAQISQQPLPPVIALGKGMTLVEVLTLLARAGIPCYAAGSENDFVTHSRWHRRPPSNGCVWSVANLAEALEHLDLPSAVLMPCSDDWTRAVAALPISLAHRFPSSSPSAEVAESLVNKWRFAQLLEQAGTPHPRTRLVSSADDLATVPAHEFRGAILKPLFSCTFCSRYRVKGYLLRDREQALQIMKENEFPILLQEFIPGPPTAAYLLDGFRDQHGRICGMLVRQRLRMFPADLGNTTLSMTVPRADVEAAEQSLRDLLAWIAYRGIFSAEFKYDARDGQFKLVEINARPWWFVEFAAHCGVDVCTMAYRDALGLPVEPVMEYELGRTCVYLVNDVRAWWRQHRGGAGLWSWVRPWFSAEGTPFHWNDPGPALAFPACMLRDHREHSGRRKPEE